MRLKYVGGTSRKKRKLIKATEIANLIFDNPNFYERISDLPQFDNTTLSNDEISTILKNYSAIVEVGTFWRLGKVTGRTNNSRIVKYNKRKLGRYLENIVKTLVHEYVHAIDFWYSSSIGSPDRMFTHVDNDNDGGEEDNTTPWAIGELGKSLALDIINN